MQIKIEIAQNTFIAEIVLSFISMIMFLCFSLIGLYINLPAF